MSKLNARGNNMKQEAPYGYGVSLNGNVQYVKSPEQVLFETLVTTLYGKEPNIQDVGGKVSIMRDKLNDVVRSKGIEGAMFALRLAQFARHKMYIRTMPMVMLVELAKILQTQNIVVPGFKDSIFNTVARADELTDLYAYALSVFGDKKKVPLSIKKGIAKAFNKFDAYQFGKYNRDGALKFKDLLRVVHPEPKDETQSLIFKKIIEDALESPYTWEVELSKNGQLPANERKSDKQMWTELIMREGSGSMGYMALFRNLRNMKQAGIDDMAWRIVADRIKDPKAVANSKVFPFTLVNTYELAKSEGVPKIVLNAINDAIELSLSNLPKLGDRVWIILDCSGSMNGGYGSMAAQAPIKVGAIFAAALCKAAKGSFQFAFTMFDDHAKFVDLNPGDSIFTCYEKIMNRNSGGGTDLQSAINQKKTLGFEPDTVFVISDMEVNRLSARNLEVFDKNCIKVAMNLNSRDVTPLPEWKGWTQLAGWSDQIFKFVPFTREAPTIVERLMQGAQ